MKKSELRTGMIVQTIHNRYGVVELEENRIDFCYDPCPDDFKNLEKVSLDDVLDYGNNQIGIGTIVTKDLKEKYSDLFKNFDVGSIAIYYEIVAVYDLNKIYDNGEGIFPPIKVE